jgi:CCR4-NOT transcription complex subunit 1
LENEDSQLKIAAHLMVQNLAGSLALVTCKEPLRHSMCNQLRAMLQKTQMIDGNTMEQTAQLIAAENLDLGCNLIEKAATEKAVREIDVALDMALMQRRKPGNPFYESFIQMQNWTRFLPESLRPKGGGLAPHHKRVYEDFARLPRERAAQVGLRHVHVSVGPFLCMRVHLLNDYQQLGMRRFFVICLCRFGHLRA